jgi:hypothetical protein
MGLLANPFFASQVEVYYISRPLWVVEGMHIIYQQLRTDRADRGLHRQRNRYLEGSGVVLENIFSSLIMVSSQI